MSQNMNRKPTANEEFRRLTQIIAQLRAPGGCPWDREQTHESLRASLIEETAETLDAIERANDVDLREELGDLLMQPLFHAQIASEENRFDLADVLHEICEKLVRRHPHVFGDAQAENTSAVLANWDAIKKQEKADKALQNKGETEDRVLETDSLISNVPPELPALSMALKVSKKAAKVGFEWENLGGVLEKMREEIDELQAEISGENRERATEELGDLLFTVVNVARWKKIDPELALRDTVRRFTQRFHAMEKGAQNQNLELDELSPAQWEMLWNAAKASE